jgi:thioredoxin reductase
MSLDTINVNSLALLSTKVASNVFDLSSGMHHVSIRDQMVRAQIVVRDLVALHKSEPAKQNINSLLIIGAGVAGICAALEAIRDVEKVVVVEAKESPFNLLRDVDCRHVGPFMYEWPSTFCQDQSYPHHKVTPWSKNSVSAARLQWTAKKPISADKLAKILTDDLRAKLNTLSATDREKIEIFINVDTEKIKNFTKDFSVTEASRATSQLQCVMLTDQEIFSYEGSRWDIVGSSRCEISPAYVLLAAGMGREVTQLISGTIEGGCNHFRGVPFWGKKSDKDDLLSAETANRHVAIFGGGDGALQDVLRALTGREHPLRFIEFLMKNLAVRKALSHVMPRLLDADRQSRQFGTWTVTVERDEYRTIDKICRIIADELSRNNRVVRRVGQGLRQGSGTVSLFVCYNHFDKVYLLNRFVVHLIEACSSKQKSMWVGRVKFSVKREHQAFGYKKENDVHRVNIRNEKDKSETEIFCDRVVVRYGIERGSVPGAGRESRTGDQMIQLSDQHSKQRVSLSRIELPFVAERI